MADQRGSTGGLVSVIMPCCGQLEYTRLSVPRVLRHTRQPFELLLIDAGSLDGTREYLSGVAAAAPVRAEVLRGGQASDFPRLYDEALGKALGAFVAWVNNDVLVTELWLQQLVFLLTANDRIGVVGPMTNVAGEHQRAAGVPYRLRRPKGRDGSSGGGRGLDTQEVDAFAKAFREANRAQWREVERVGGFCWLARREVLRGAALLDAEAGGVFDERKFGERVRQTGHHLMCCRDIFVHHFGTHLIDG